MQTQESDEANNDLNVGKVENQVGGAVESNGESENHVEPPPTASPVRRARYRPPEGFSPRQLQLFPCALDKCH